MKDQDIQEQLLALRREVGALSDSLLNLHRDESRRVAGEQWRMILGEWVDRFLMQTEREGNSEKVGLYKSELNDLVDRFITTFQNHGKEKASMVLGEFEKTISPNGSRAHDAKYVHFAYEIIRQMNSYLEVSDALANPTMPEVGSLLGPSKTSARASLSPTIAERILSPLANAWRISVLLKLAEGDNNLTDLSKALGLKKGHMQFHLASLLESKYIAYDQKSHLYSITSNGIVAIDEITKMIDRLSSLD